MMNFRRENGCEMRLSVLALVVSALIFFGGLMLAQTGGKAQSTQTNDLAATRKAAEQGDAKAQNKLGEDYDLGEGVPQDYAQAAVWYRKAAEQGLAEAQTSLGAMYDNGQGVPQDYAQAAIWFRKAAEQGDADAQWCLAELFKVGQGVPQDYAEAYFWLDIAGAAGIEGAKQLGEDINKSRDEAASHLTPTELSRVQERARKWFEDHPPE